MGIKAGKILINDRAVDKNTLMKNRNLSLVDQVSRERGLPIKSKSSEIVVVEDGIEKLIGKKSKYVNDLTNREE